MICSSKGIGITIPVGIFESDERVDFMNFNYFSKYTVFFTKMIYYFYVI